MDGLINSFPIKFRQKISIKDSGCWEWIGARDRHGYGRYYCRLKYKSIGKKNHTLAHRFSWEHFKGQIPLNLFVCHKCDNPPCVNPEHLFLGTTQDNTRDCINKGRHWSINRSKARTFCKNGHEWNKNNIYLYKGVVKDCRQCAKTRYTKKYSPIALTNAERRNKRTKCCNGHAWVVENLYIDKNGYKLCRICRAIHKKNSRKRSSEKNLVVE